MIPSWLILSNIRYVSRVKWSNPGNGIAPSPTPRCSSYWKGSLLVSLDYGLYFNYFLSFGKDLVDFSQVKFSLAPRSRSFPQTLKFASGKYFVIQSDYFEASKKYENHLVQSLINTLNGLEKTSLSSILFLRGSCWMWPCVFRERHSVSPFYECREFSQRIFMHTLQLLRI